MQKWFPRPVEWLAAVLALALFVGAAYHILYFAASFSIAVSIVLVATMAILLVSIASRYRKARLFPSRIISIDMEVTLTLGADGRPVAHVMRKAVVQPYEKGEEKYARMMYYTDTYRGEPGRKVLQNLKHDFKISSVPRFGKNDVAIGAADCDADVSDFREMIIKAKVPSKFDKPMAKFMIQESVELNNPFDRAEEYFEIVVPNPIERLTLRIVFDQLKATKGMYSTSHGIREGKKKPIKFTEHRTDTKTLTCIHRTFHQPMLGSAIKFYWTYAERSWAT